MFFVVSTDSIWDCVDQLALTGVVPLSLEETDSREVVPLERLKLTTVPFIACGDLRGFDSETTYPLDVRNTLHYC